ncbi:hypothetical protein WJX81_003544 [Elliptochloris bilobata]|uniref:SAC3/GANP/THP3 conserved domain-containing protein n=1 Tax=Elliptochloris bilobata TaxID=381761 RepID=A0AAW1SH77_9CHLO
MEPEESPHGKPSAFNARGGGGQAPGGFRGGGGWANRAGSPPPPMGGGSPGPGACDASGDDDEGDGPQGVVGTCEEMCPAAELAQRRRIEDIAQLERLDPNERRTNASMAVKKFTRHVGGAPEEFRTRGALARTQAHLRAIMDRGDVPLVQLHKFLWDRFRSVRQDIYVQGFDDAAAIAMVEEHVRFMILAEHELCEQTVVGADQEAFNSHLNLEQINKALITLMDLYNTAAARGEPSPSEGEFRSYTLLTTIGTHGNFSYNTATFINMLRKCRPAVLASADVQRVLGLQRLLGSGTWVGFLRAATAAPYLQACLAHMYFPRVHARALCVLARTSGPHQAPISLHGIARTLVLDDEAAAERLCGDMGLPPPEHGADGAPPAISLLRLREGAMEQIRLPRRRSRLISAKARALSAAAAADPAAAAAAAVASQEHRRTQMEAENQRRQEKARAAECAAAEAHAATQRDQARRRAAEAAEAQRLQAEQERRRADEARRAAEAAQRQREAQARAEAEERARREQQARQQAAEAVDRRRRAADVERLRAQQEREHQQEAAARALAARWRCRRALAAWRAYVVRQREGRLATLRACSVSFPGAASPQAPEGSGAEGDMQEHQLRVKARLDQQRSPARPPAPKLDVAALVARALAARAARAAPDLGTLTLNPGGGGGGAPLFWKLLLLCAPGGAQGGAADWLHARLSGGRATHATSAGQVSELERAAAGASALALLLAQQDAPTEMAAMLEAAVAALPAGTPPLPLVVLVASTQDMTAGVEAWLSRLVDTGELGKRVGGWKVLRLTGADGVPDTGVLSAALLWLAERAPAQPAIEAASLFELARAALEPRLAELALEPSAPPAAWLAALRGALADARERVASAACSPAAAWHFPPPECCISAAAADRDSPGTPSTGAAELSERAAFPADWHSPAALAAAEAALRSAELPDPQGGDAWRCWGQPASEAEWQAAATRYLAARVDVPGLPPSAARLTALMEASADVC